MLLVVIGIGLAFMLLERLRPDQQLQRVPGWWTRVILINIVQYGIVVLSGHTWDVWFTSGRIMDLQAHMSAPLGAFVVYLFVTFVFYWWHRWRHEVYFFWLICHQLHHSASRIETITSFYKHPIELVINSIMIAFITFGLFGLSVEGSGWLLLYTATGEYFYHMNVRTPPWLGYVFQRPEMHRIHHERGRHYSNFSDLPVWDMLFGTFRNPPTFDRPCGFKPEREQKFWQILACRDVNDPMPTRKLEKSA